MRKNHVGLFHKIIIASLCCMVLAGCGYKAAPYWEEAPKIDKKVKT